MSPTPPPYISFPTKSEGRRPAADASTAGGGCASSVSRARGTGGSANPVQQCYQVGTVLICYGGELQTPAAPREHKPPPPSVPSFSFPTKKKKASLLPPEGRQLGATEQTPH